MPSPIRADVIVTASGSPETARAVHRAGGLVGNASDDTELPAAIPVDFVDYPFDRENFDWLRHKARVQSRKPKYAVAPDVQEGTSLRRAIERGDELLDAGAEHVIIAPKTAHPREIPSRFRVGLPFQPEFGPGGLALDSAEQATLDPDAPVLDDFADVGVGPVHVLGGPPHDQLELPRRGIEVRSVDTSLPWVYAQRGRRIWTRNGQFTVPDLTAHEALEASVREMLREWDHDVERHPDVPDAIWELMDQPDPQGEARRRLRRGPPIAEADDPDEVDRFARTLASIVDNEDLLPPP